MDGLETAISILLNEAMKVERSRALGAEPWQRSEQRLGYANGTLIDHRAVSRNDQIAGQPHGQQNFRLPLPRLVIGTNQQNHRVRLLGRLP
jgi:hypothetical protein